MSSKNSEKNERLDFYSPKFDAFEALYSDNLVLPCPDVKGYDNLATFESIHINPKPEKINKNSRQKDVKQKEESGMETRRFLPHQMPVKHQRPPRKEKNVFTKMETVEGPLAALRKYKDEKIKIKIVNRNITGVRGYYIAYLVAFDKHWNLALEDVTEVWTRKKRPKVPALENANTQNKCVQKNRIQPPEINVIKTDKNTETCTRFVEQLLVRGEHIVIIYPYSE